jgi:hypothetical protein
LRDAHFNPAQHGEDLFRRKYLLGHNQLLSHSGWNYLSTWYKISRSRQ